MPQKGENIYKRKDGRWEARFIKGYHEDGSAILGYLYAYSYTEVRKKRALFIAESYRGTAHNDVKTAPITVILLLNEWLAEQKRSVKESTYTRYFFLIDKYIKPKFGTLKLKQLSSTHIDRFVDELAVSGRLDGDGGLSAKMIKDTVSVLKLAIRYAENKKFITEGAVRVPETKSKKTNIVILSNTDRIKLEHYLSFDNDPCKFGIILCLYTGIRIGEICALRWENIDFVNASLVITGTLQRISETDGNTSKKTKLIFQGPKTESSVRVIPLPVFLLDKMKLLSIEKSGKDFFLSGSQLPVEPRCYSYKYKQYLSDCNASDYTFHALRHTFATRCVEEGFDIKSLSEILGHASVKTTLDRYVHPTMELKRSQMEKLASSLK